MTTSTKPREFFVCELLTGEVLIFRDYQNGRTKVIEYSAYQALKDEIQRLRKALEYMKRQNTQWTQKELDEIMELE